MNRVSYFIDGFNLYHAIAENPLLRKYKWIDLKKICECFLKPDDTISDIFYFTALATWDSKKVARHRIFIKAQEMNGVKTIYGEFRRKTKQCRKCYKIFDTFEEKETDVNIAIQLFEQAVKDTYDIAIILSGDSDQLPALRAVKRNFPAKKFGIIIPPGRGAELLKKEADFYRKIKAKHLHTCKLPIEIYQHETKVLECPAKWI